jgi:glycosyltransferase involved in cell wall biosynthesis
MTPAGLRIMLLVNEFPPEKIAGTAMATEALAEHLTRRGHRVLVVVTRPCPDACRHRLPAADYALIWMSPRPVRGTGLLWRIWQAWRAARAFRPQIVQGQAVSCGLMAAVVGRLLRVPSIAYAQGYDVYEASCWQRRTEIRWGCRWPDKCLAVTRHLAAEIRKATGGGEAQVMPHAFTMPEQAIGRDAARAGCGISGEVPLVFSAGRLEGFKGHDVLLRAWPGFSARYPAARLRIAGSGSRLESLRGQALALGIEGSVDFVGQLSAAEVHRCMAAADLFVLPSRAEPFGIVLLEAMAHGLPLVASDVGGIPEVVPAHGDVRLVPPDDAEALQAAMLEMVSRGPAVSETNRRHAMSFAWGLQVERFESLYRQLLAEARP